MTQAELGLAVGRQQQAVTRWETDKDSPDAEMVRRLTEVLGLHPVEACVALGYIAADWKDRPAPVDTESAINTDAGMSEEGRTIVLATYRAARASHAPVRHLRRVARTPDINDRYP